MARMRLLAPRRPAPLTAALSQQTSQKPAGVTFGRDRPLPWQLDAWRFYDELGMIKFYANYRGNALGKVKLYVGVENPDGTAPIHVDDPDADFDPMLAAVAMEELAALRDPVEGQAGILRFLGLNQAVAGECRLLGRDDQGPETWKIYSVEELRRGTDGLWETRSDPYSHKADEILPADSFVTRLWRPHPRRRLLADCSMRGVLADCATLALLEQDIIGTAQSRLSGSGILALKKGLDGHNRGPEDGADEEPSQFVEDLLEHIIAPIRNPGTAAAVAPLISEFALGQGERLSDVIQHITFDRKMDPVLAAQRDEKRKVIAGGLDLPNETILGLGDVNHWCMPTDTEILTDHGWVTEDQLGVGDVVLTLNHDSGLSEWKPVQDKARFEVNDLPMVAVENKFHSSLSTVNHRWPVIKQSGKRAWTVSEDLFQTDRIVTAAPNADLPTEPKWSDAFVELVGWFFTEGTCRWGTAKTPQVIIGQSHKANPDNVARIRRALTTLYGPPTEGRVSLKGIPRGEGPAAWRENVEARGMTLFSLSKAAAAPLLEVAPAKIVSREFILSLTHSQLLVFLESAGRGDGDIRGGAYIVNQRDPQRLDAVELAGILAGRPVRRSTRMTGGFELKKQTYQSVMTGKRSTVQAGAATVERYTGTIWCPVTENHTWLARRNGTVYYTGNTGFLVNDEAWKGHLEPDVVTACAQLASGYLRPKIAARFATMPGEVDPKLREQLDRLVIGYDESEVVNHPNRGQDANDGHDRYVLSDDAWRRYKGFSDTDAPDPAEVAARVEVQRLIHARGAVPGDIPIGDVTAPGEEAPGLPATKPQETPTMPTATTASLVAAGSPRPVAERLLSLDQRLRARVEAAADTATRRALEKAGNRIATKVTKQPALKATVAGVPRTHAAAVLGRSVVASLDLTDDDLLDGCYDDFADQTDSWVDDTQQSALSVLVTDLHRNGVQVATVASTLALLRDRGQTPSTSLLLAALAESADGALSASLRDAAGHIEQDYATGRALLLAGLQDRVRKLLYSPDPFAETAGRGEYDGTILAPMGVIRDALNTFGGGRAGMPTSAEAVAAGSRTLGIAKAGGYVVDSYEWRHDSPQHPFEPHENLDGTVFTNPDDPRLDAGDDEAWIETQSGGYFPADHDGCRCDLLPQLVYVSADESQAA